MIPASYVLFDTWFCSPSSLIAIKEMGYDVIAMAKKTSKMHYLYNGIMQPLTEIYKQNRKRRGRSRYLLSVEVSIEKTENLFLLELYLSETGIIEKTIWHLLPRI